MNCRFDGLPATQEFVDLGFSPASNSFLTKEQLNLPEVYYPLKVYVSERSFLVQVDEYKRHDDIFTSDYVYYSSYSKSLLAHSKEYVEMMIERFKFNSKSQVVEIASNDGYLLQYFKEKDIPVLGIEPTAGTAAISRNKGIENWVEFFGVELATKMKQEGRMADLLLGNNVLAHVPNINDFVAGLAIALKPTGVITMEFPHLMQLVDFNQFDLIYHEHFSYLSLLATKTIFNKHNLEIFDVQEVATQGGSLRIFAKHLSDTTHKINPAVQAFLTKEINAGLSTIAYYQGFQQKVNTVKNEFLTFLLEKKRHGKKIVGYGAAAKGNTLMNYAGIKTDLIDFVVDANPYKQNKYLPGSHLPVVNEQALMEAKPDYIIIFPWNIKNEIVDQLNYVRDWGTQFVTVIPSIEIF
jgi:SAM-dependent methyltransferase